MATGLANAGHEVHVLQLGAKASERADRNVLIRTVQSHQTRGIAWYQDRRALARAAEELVENNRLDILEVPDYLGYLPFRVRRCQVAVRLHLSASTIAAERGVRPALIPHLCERMTLKRHRNWIAVSEHSMRLTIRTFGLRPKQSRTIYYPITLSEGGSAPRSLPERFVLFAGTVSARKGAMRLAAAARSFLQNDPNCHLVFAGQEHQVGSSPISAEIHDLVGDQLSKRVHFLGRLTHAETLACMKRAAAFVFPSSLETFGLVVGEAMLCGCPVVVPNIPPFTEFVEHDSTGLLVSTVDDTAALADSVSQILCDPARAAAMGRTAQAAISGRFSLERSMSDSLAFYGDLLKDRSPGQDATVTDFATERCSQVPASRFE